MLKGATSLMNKVKISVSLDKQAYTQLKSIASEQGTNVSSMLQEAAELRYGLLKNPLDLI